MIWLIELIPYIQVWSSSYESFTLNDTYKCTDMIGNIIYKIDSNNIIALVNGVILKAYTWEALEINQPQELEFIPFLTAKVNKESFLNLNTRGDKKLIIDNSYQALGEIVSIEPLLIDCGAIELELDEDDLHEDIEMFELEVGMSVYFFIDRLDIERIV